MKIVSSVYLLSLFLIMTTLWIPYEDCNAYDISQGYNFHVSQQQIAHTVIKRSCLVAYYCNLQVESWSYFPRIG